jgi:hypothetical protein
MPLSHESPRPDVAVEVDERLDEELDQTFPASDPLPWCHDIVPAVRIRPVRGNSIAK